MFVFDVLLPLFLGSNLNMNKSHLCRQENGIIARLIPSETCAAESGLLQFECLIRPLPVPFIFVASVALLAHGVSLNA